MIAARPLVIMDEYNFHELWKWLECIVSSCECDTWLQCVEHLKQYFDWEYDNYMYR
ncbi:Imm8 family immunity protein [Escherichia coli]